MIEILDPGPLALVEDLGRAGYAHLGVPRSGAADLVSHRLANRLVGNPEESATIELLFGGAKFSTDEELWLAVTGAHTPVLVDGRPVPLNQAFRVHPGSEIELGRPVSGLRSYIAASGGIDAPAELGSRASDTLAGLGPSPLQAGSILPVGSHRCPPPPSPDAVRDTIPVHESRRALVLRYHRGPRDDWFSTSALEAFESTAWEITSQSDRVGVRLAGPELHTAVEDHLPSEGMVLGAVEVPPSGQPIVFLADHPTSGGYPVIGVITARSTAVLAQTQPGRRVVFSPRS